MKKMVLSTVLACCIFNSNGQKIISDIFMPGTILIKYSTGGSSSGVIVGDSSYMYLVTARHCLIENFNKNSVRLVAPSVVLIYYIGDPSSSKSDSLRVDLQKAFADGELLFDSTQDIAILSIAKFTGKTASGSPSFNYMSSATKLTLFAPGIILSELDFDFDHVEVGDDCLMFGYPSSLELSSGKDYNFDRPLLRKGVIAGKDKTKGTIIIDCPSYQGNSGGPVFSVALTNRKDPTGLIGVVSRSILQVEELQSSYYHQTVSMNLSNSGYTIIVPIEFAEKLMKKHLALMIK